MPSLKRERRESTERVLKATGSFIKDECAACGLNCEVRHTGVGFWARVEGLEPIYKITTDGVGRRVVMNCPKDKCVGKIKRAKNARKAMSK